MNDDKLTILNRDGSIPSVKPLKPWTPGEFNQHLDGCDQCKNHPFGLCETGQELLKKEIEATNITAAPADETVREEKSREEKYLQDPTLSAYIVPNRADRRRAAAKARKARREKSRSYGKQRK